MVVIEMFIGWLITTSIKSSLMVAVLLLVKKILDKGLAASGHYYIWLLLIIRLTAPFSPQSKVSIFNLLNLNKDKTIIAGNNVLLASGQDISSLMNEPIMDKLVFSGSFLYSTDFKIMVIWLIGAIIFCTLTIRMNFVYWKKIRASCTQANKEVISILEKCKSIMNVNKRIDVLITEGVSTPALYGLLKPKILIPAEMGKRLSSEEYQHIFLHELAHFKKKDLPIFILISIIQILHWFNPVLWFGFHRMRQDCEIACDALVLSKLSSDQYTSYGQTIIHLLQDFSSTFHPAVRVGILGTGTQIKRRIIMIKSFKKRSFASFIIPLMVCLALGFTLLTGSIEASDKETGAQTTYHEEITPSETEGKVDPYKKLQMQWPVPDYTKIASYYGMKKHPVTKEEKLHTGIDIVAPLGTCIVAPASGKVLLAEWQKDYGKTMIIDHGEGITTVYSHCSTLLLEKGAKVKSGDKIAEVGSTGLSAGPHLHLEVRENTEPVDPLKGFLKEQNQ